MAAREEPGVGGTPDYKYTKLPGNIPNESYFRILRVLPATGVDSIVHCTLIIEKLPPAGARKEHLCVSYRWKEDDPFRHILIDGKRFQVYANVYQFLLIARETFPGEEIWIDAICINQEDRPEKEHQIPLMREIYLHARVLSYLGNDDPILEKCLEMIRQNKSTKSHFNAANLATGDSQAEFFMRMDHHLLGFMNNEYWGRAWIIQELLLGGEGRVLAGRSQVSWEKLFEYTISMSDPSSSLSSTDPWAFANTRLATVARNKTLGSQMLSKTVAELLDQFVDVGCKRFHDRIYALLGLAVDRHRVTVDYGLSKDEFFFGTCKAICGDRGPENDKGGCLCFCGRLAFCVGLEREFLGLESHGSYESWIQGVRDRYSRGMISNVPFRSPGLPFVSFQMKGGNVHAITPKPLGRNVQRYDDFLGVFTSKHGSATLLLESDFRYVGFLVTESTDRRGWYCSGIYKMGWPLITFAEGEAAGVWPGIEMLNDRYHMRIFLTREAFLGLATLITAVLAQDHKCDLSESYTYVERGEGNHDDGDLQLVRQRTSELFGDWLDEEVEEEPDEHWSYDPDEERDWDFSRGGFEA